MKKFFNITAIFNEMMIIKFMKLHSQSVKKMKEILFTAECSQIAFIINRVHIDTLLNSKSQINLIKQLIAEQCSFSIQHKVILKMQNINTNSFKMISYMKHVKIKIIKINIFIILFMKNDCNNNLLLNCF